MNPIFLIRSIIFLSIALVSSGQDRAFAGGNRSKSKKESQSVDEKASKSANPKEAINISFTKFIELSRSGKVPRKAAWESLNRFEPNFLALSHDNQEANLLLRSQLLTELSYPILSAEYAANGLNIAKDPFAERYTNTWKDLWEISKVRNIHYLLEDIAIKHPTPATPPPEFSTNWFYIQGNALLSQSKDKDAKSAFEKVVMQDRYYMPSQYQLAMISIQQKKSEDAESYLKAILSPTVQDLADLKSKEKLDLIQYAHMALGRLYYQDGRFLEAVQQYRKIPRQSRLFYDALFEQAWALFLAGSLKHGLGSLYGVNSPYFADKFNPESKVLESMMYYWMCRHDDARRALADLSDDNLQSIQSLGNFLDRQRLSPDTAFQLFENLIAGVSETSLGIPEDVLKTAANSDTMMLVRDQYATILEERNKLDTFGIFGMIDPTSTYHEVLNKRLSTLRTTVGSTFLAELRELKQEFDEIYSQSQFLYLELLMSQKEQLLGRELHADGKVTKVTEKNSLQGWSRKTQSWTDNKSEYWWDELGYHVIDVEPECKI